MGFAVAVVSPLDHHDISGGGFNEVADALHHGLLALGHDSVLTNRLDLDERRTIVLGGNLLVQYALEPPKNPIFYNLEQLGDDLPWMTMPEFVDPLPALPDVGLQSSQRRVPRWPGTAPAHLRSDRIRPGADPDRPRPEDIDVLFYGALNGRRYAILRDLHERGLCVKWLSGAYGASRDAWIARSKIVLNLHYWEAKIFAIVRVSYLLANRRAVVSEHSADPTLGRDLASGIAFADYDELVDRCVDLVDDERARRELVERGYQLFAARDQADILRRALSADPEGVIHKTAARDDLCIDVRPEDEDRSAEDLLRERQLFTRNLFKHKAAQERDWLLAEVKRNPEDARSVFFLAETSFRMEDFDNARRWYARRVEMGGSDEEAYWAMYRLAHSTQQLGSPWPDFEDAYLRAWHFRPTRAEPLYAVAAAYHDMQRYRVGHLIAQRAAEIPFPEEDLFVPRYADVYAWRAADEQAVCASWIGRHAEAFTLCRRLLARPDMPEPDRQRIAANRDFSVPAMLKAAAPYPQALVQSLAAGPGAEAEVTVSLVADQTGRLPSRPLTRFCTAASMCRGSGGFWCSMPACPPPTAPSCRNVTGFSGSPVADPATSPPPSWRSCALRSTDGSGCTWAGAGGSSPPRTSSPPDRGARRRTTGVSSGHQLRRCGQTDRRQCSRGGGAPGTRGRPLPPDRGDGHRPGDVRHRTPGSGPWCAKQRPRSARPT
jgi:hypothetical protein